MEKAASAKLKLGVLSDIRLTDEASAPVFRAALEYFRGQDVDAVLCAGDLTDHGSREEFKLASTNWHAVFSEESSVARLFIRGDHDDPKVAAAAWKKVAGEPFEPISLRRVKGFAFVLNNQLEATDVTAAFFAAHADELKRETLFFYAQHKHPKGTCSAPWVWGQDDGRITEILAAFPNCIAFSGHSHATLTDDRTIRQGDFKFTSVGTGALRYILPFGGRENSSVKGVKETQDKQMPDLLAGPARAAHQAMVVSVYDDHLAFARYDVDAKAPLGADWILPRDGSQPFTYEARAGKAPVPQFAKGAAVEVAETKGQTRRGKKANQVVVSFPPALLDAHAFDYEVTAVKKESDLTLVARRKRVFSPAFCRASACEPARVTCVFARDELPWVLPFRFVVRPLNCFGRAGKAIVSEPVVLAAGKEAQA